MNLTKLFEIQAKLDDHIEREHPRQPGEERLAKKILALQVELGELANELPEVFKYWSNKKNNYDKALKEYVDGLHFILSIGLELGMNEVADELELKRFHFLTSDKTTNCFIGLNFDVADLHYRQEDEDIFYFYESAFSEFIKLGELIGFTLDQIEQAYFEKNKVNHQRQEDGY